MPPARWWPRSVVLAVTVVALVAVAIPSAAQGQASDLARDLDAVISLSPPDTCLVVRIDGREHYAHRPDDLQAPASTQKLLTGAAALDLLGPAHRFTTSLVTEAPVRDGVVTGDVILVGGGDPTVVTSMYRAIRRVPEDQPTTLLDALARRLREAGIRRIDGRVLGDESRFDALRTVPTWPARFVAQDQSGPLSALSVDDGHRLEPAPGGFRRVRSDDPPTDAARALIAVMGARGIDVRGGAGTTTAPAGARPLAAIESPPLAAVVADVIRRSDNHGAELLAKHLGLHQGGEGSSAAGARAVADWARQEAVAPPGTYVADGSGLDPTNLVTCRQLVDVLDRSGPAGELATGLAVAGRSGTLAGRFRGGAAEGRLRAKTGRLNGVSALAGFVELRNGSVATFAYLANGPAISGPQLRAQDFLAEILGRAVPACPEARAPDLVVTLAPATAALVQAAVLSGGVGAGALAPTMAALDGTARRASRWLDRCSRETGAQLRRPGS